MSPFFRLRAPVLLFIMLLPGVLFSSTSGTDDREEAETKLPTPAERPRLPGKGEMHPYRQSPLRGYYPGSWHTRGWAYPYYGLWGRGHYSHLYFDTMYGSIPAPGRSELSVSFGSNDYFGTSLSHTGYLHKKSGWLYNVAALWETGETYWSERDYESFTVAPSLFWANDQTSFYIGFEYTESRYSGNGRVFRFEDTENSESTQWIRWDEPDQHTLERASVGVRHEVNDFFSIGLHLDASDHKFRPEKSHPGSE